MSTKQSEPLKKSINSKHCFIIIKRNTAAICLFHKNSRINKLRFFKDCIHIKYYINS